MLKHRLSRLIPLMLIFMILNLLLWGFIFTRITDTRREEKIVVFVDAEAPEAGKLANILEDMALSPLRMVQVRPFSYAMLNSGTLTQADLLILPASDMSTYLDWYAPCPDEYPDDPDRWTYEGVPYGVPLDGLPDGGSALAEYIQFVPGERYYLVFGRQSLHLRGNEGAVDHWAIVYANALLNGLQQR